MDDEFSIKNLALDFLPDGAMLFDKDGRINYWNKSAGEILGLNEKEEINHLGWPESLSLYQANREILCQKEELPQIRAMEGKVIDQKLWVKNKKNNMAVCLSFQAQTIKCKEEIIGSIVSFRDLTDKDSKEQQMISERTFYHQILDALPVFISTRDLNGNYTFMNKAFKERLTKQDLKKSHVPNPGLFGLIAEHDHQAINNKDVLKFEDEVMVDGKLSFYRSTRIPMLNSNGKVMCISEITFDMTEEMQRNIDLDKQNAKMAKSSKMAALGIMASEIGHEINNPLAIINTTTKVLKQMIEDVEAKEEILKRLSIISETVPRITDIVSALSNVSRDSSKDHFKECMLREIIKDVISLSESRFRFHGIKLIEEMNPDLMDIKISCLRVQLSEVFINLLSNACDAVEEMKERWIRLQVDHDEDNVFIRISDSGKGVPAEIKESIFESFFSTKEIGKGTGLGLSISKNIVEKHAGDLYLDPQLSSCFIVKLPKRLPDHFK